MSNWNGHFLIRENGSAGPIFAQFHFAASGPKIAQPSTLGHADRSLPEQDLRLKEEACTLSTNRIENAIAVGVLIGLAIIN